jgi:hypothetical protein
MRLEQVTGVDAHWLESTLDRISRPFGVRVGLAPDRMLVARPAATDESSPRADPGPRCPP